MTLPFAVKEAQRRTEVLGRAHYVYNSLFDAGEYYISDEVKNGNRAVYSVFPDGSELES